MNGLKDLPLTDGEQEQRALKIPTRKVAVLGLLVIALCVMIGEFAPLGMDYVLYFRRTAERVSQADATLYSDDTPGYYASPWGLSLIVPTLILPPHYGQAVTTTVTLLAVALATYTFAGGDLLVIPLAALNYHVLRLVVNGNLDGYILLGLVMAVWAVEVRKPWVLGVGFWLMSVKPVNVIPVSVLLIWLTREWSFKEKVAYATPVVASLLASLLIFDFWPARYIQYVRQSPPYTNPRVTGWRALEYFDLSRHFMWPVAAASVAAVAMRMRQGVGHRRLVALVSTATFVVTPYATCSHFVLLTPSLALAVSDRRIHAAVWALTFLPFLTLIWGSKLFWVAIAYPLVLLIILSVSSVRSHRDGSSQTQPCQSTD